MACACGSSAFWGIPISVDASWLIILALLTLSLGSGFPVLLGQYFPGYPVDLAPYEYWLMGLVASLAFFGCILLHEMGHAVVAEISGHAYSRCYALPVWRGR